MKKKLYLFLAAAAIAFSLQSCNKDDNDNSVPHDLRIVNFVWKGMNQYYLWQPDVPDLADDRFANQTALNDYLKQNTDPIQLFNHLRVSDSIDRFSVIFADYRQLEGLLAGTTENNGVDFALYHKSGSDTEVFGIVRYILPNSSASSQDIHRGDTFYAVNGTPLTVDNYQTLLAAESYTLNLADYDGGNITPNGQSVSLTKAEYSENPILVNTVITSGPHKIGYLMYNGFYPNYDTQLNAAVGQLQSQGITDLVLDLRYNGGGSIKSATYLASMITGQFNGQVFAQEHWNPKMQAYFEDHSPSDLIDKFVDQTDDGLALNHLNLTTVYIITSNRTASASELVINCLKAYINVVQIGDVTVGKNVGSVTLYDSPNFGKQDADPTHYYAMQPIVLKIEDKNGFGEYTNGLVPSTEIVEDLANLGELGMQTDPLLNTAIGIITGNSGRHSASSQGSRIRSFKDTKSMNGLQNQMYLDKFPAVNLNQIK
jgi:C-terminal processing protease CtpA/Prc